MPPEFYSPPKMARRILQKILPESDNHFLCGDFDEIYNDIFTEKGPMAARLWYCYQLVQSLPRIVAHSISWRIVMFMNFLKITLRNLKRHKGYSFINITGLAIGMTFVLAIMIFIRHELSYDRHHEKASQIYRVNTILGSRDNENKIAAASPAVAEALVNECPEILQATRIFKTLTVHTVKNRDKSFFEERFYYADPTVFEVFTFPLLKGDFQTALAQPHSIILTYETAKKYFPREDPIGKTLIVNDGEGDVAYLVKGIAADNPENSHFHFDFLASFADQEISRVKNWFLIATHTYILLQENYHPSGLEAKLPELIHKYASPLFGERFTFDDWLSEGNKFEMFLQPLLDIHLHSRNIRAQLETNGNIVHVTIFSLIAFFILLIACVNFMNLTTARSSIRANEIGVRKVLGSTRLLLVRQFLVESVLLSLFALVLALFFLYFSLPFLNNLLGRQMQVTALINWHVLPVLIAFALFTGLLAGSYPAFFLSAFHPVRILKGQFEATKRKSRLRYGLVVFQFSLSVILFIGTAVISGQLEYIQTREMGFDKEHVVTLRTTAGTLDRQDSLKQELLQYPDLLSVSLSSSLPGKQTFEETLRPSGTDSGSGIVLTLLESDSDFAEVLGLELISGRFFQREFSSVSPSIVINESASQRLCAAYCWKDPLGKQVTTGRQIFTIVGVLEDFHFHSLHTKIGPLGILPLPKGQGQYMSIRIRPENIPQTMSFIKDKWITFAPDQPIQYSFLDDDFERLYNPEKRTRRLLAVFALLSVFIGCLGLFGLASYSVEQRTKEIGIRKILGASVTNIAMMLLRQFSVWVLLANIVAWPVAFYVMNLWLQNFAYRTEINLFMFIGSGLLVFGIANLAVSYQAIKCAVAHPADSLRYE